MKQPILDKASQVRQFIFTKDSNNNQLYPGVDTELLFIEIVSTGFFIVLIFCLSTSIALILEQLLKRN